MKIRPVGPDLIQTDGQVDKETEIMKLRVAFSQFFQTP